MELYVFVKINFKKGLRGPPLTKLEIFFITFISYLKTQPYINTHKYRDTNTTKC